MQIAGLNIAAIPQPKLVLTRGNLECLLHGRIDSPRTHCYFPGYGLPAIGHGRRNLAGRGAALPFQADRNSSHVVRPSGHRLRFHRPSRHRRTLPTSARASGSDAVSMGGRRRLPGREIPSQRNRKTASLRSTPTLDVSTWIDCRPLSCGLISAFAGKSSPGRRTHRVSAKSVTAAGRRAALNNKLQLQHDAILGHMQPVQLFHTQALGIRSPYILSRPADYQPARRVRFTPPLPHFRRIGRAAGARHIQTDKSRWKTNLQSCT